MPKVIQKGFKERYIVCSLVLLCVASAFVMAGTPGASAGRSANATASITVESTCSMTATVNTAHTATLVNGIYSGTYSTGGSTPYANGIGQTTIQTFCNDQNGYAIYAIGFTNDTLGNTKLEGAGLSSAYDIVTGTATSGTAGSDISNWAMKVSAVASDPSNTYTPSIINGFDSFSAVPNSYTKVAKLDKATDSTAGTNLGSTITTTYAAYISNTQPAGTYTGQVKYALVHPNVSAAPDTLVMQEIANWKGDLLPGVQTTAVDNRDGSVYTVALMSVDTDNDGNADYDEVWMTQNLDLKIGGTYNNNPIVLTSENTDLRQYQADGTTFAGYSYNNGVITWTPSGNPTVTGTPATITNFASGNPANSVSGWTNDGTKPYMAEGEDVIMFNGTKYETTRNDTTGVVTTALAACQNANHTEAECLHYRVGNYYNWTAAVAMNNTGSYSADYTVMPNSICPAGWRLPNGLTQDNNNVVMSDFNKLLKAYNITGSNGSPAGVDLVGSVNVGWGTNGFTKIGNAPLYFARSGYVNDTTLYYFSGLGYYWSSTVYSGSYAYYLLYYSGELYPANRYNRGYGWSVRCIAR